MNGGINITVYNSKSVQEAAERAEVAAKKAADIQFFNLKNEIPAPTGLILPKVRPNDLPLQSGDVMEVNKGSYTNVDSTILPVVKDKGRMYYNGTKWMVSLEWDLAKGSNGTNGKDGKVIADWTAVDAVTGLEKKYIKGDQSFNGGKIWEANAATLATDVPGVSAKWDEKVGGSNIPDADVLSLTGYSYIFLAQSALFEQGDFNNLGVPTVSEFFIRTINYLPSVKIGINHTVTIPSGLIGRLHYYNSDGSSAGLSIALSAGTHSITFLVANIKLTLRYASATTAIIPANADTTPRTSVTANVNKISENITANTAAIAVNSDKLNNINSLIGEIDINHTIVALEMQTGNINDATGVNITHGSYLRSSGYITDLVAGQSVTIESDADVEWRVGVFYYDENDNYIGGIAPSLDTKSPYTSTILGSKLRIVYCKNPLSTLSSSILSSGSFKYIYKVDSLPDRIEPIIDFDTNFISPNTELRRIFLNKNNFDISSTGARIIIKKGYSLSNIKNIVAAPPSTLVTVGITTFSSGSLTNDTGLRNYVLNVNVNAADYFNIIFGGTHLTLDVLDGYYIDVLIDASAKLNKVVKPLHKGNTWMLGLNSWSHRGTFLGGIAPENSLDSTEMSARAGFEWAEVDLMKTLDGHFVMWHDATLSRVLRNKFDYSVISPDVNFSDLTMSQLQSNYVFASNHPYQRKPVPSLEQFLRACRLYNIKPFIELKGVFTNNDLDQIYNKCSEVLGKDNFGFLSLGDGTYINYLRAKSPNLLLAYGGGIFLNPNDPIWTTTQKEKTYVSVGNNWLGSNAASQVPMFNRMGVGVIAWGVDMSKLNEYSSLGVSIYTIDNLPPSLKNKPVLFSVDSKTNDYNAYFLKNNVPINQNHLSEGIDLLINDVLKLAPYIDDEIVDFGAYEVMVNFTGSLKFEGTRLNQTYSSINLTNETYFYRMILSGDQVGFRATAQLGTKIHRITVRAVKY